MKNENENVMRMRMIVIMMNLKSNIGIMKCIDIDVMLIIGESVTTLVMMPIIMKTELKPPMY